MSTDVRPKCLGEAMLSRRSCNDKVCHWCWEQKNLHNCPEWDIPSAPPSLSLLLSLFLVSLQDQVQLNLRFLAGTSRFTVQWKHFFHSLPAEEKRMSRGFQMRPHLPVKNLLNCLTFSGYVPYRWNSLHKFKDFARTTFSQFMTIVERLPIICIWL